MRVINFILAYLHSNRKLINGVRGTYTPVLCQSDARLWKKRNEFLITQTFHMRRLMNNMQKRGKYLHAYSIRPSRM